VEELDDDEEEEDWDEEGGDGRGEAGPEEEDVGRDKEDITNLFQKNWKDERRNKDRSARHKITRLSEQIRTKKQCLNTMKTPYLYPQRSQNTKRHNHLNR